VLIHSPARDHSAHEQVARCGHEAKLLLIDDFPFSSRSKIRNSSSQFLQEQNTFSLPALSRVQTS